MAADFLGKFKKQISSLKDSLPFRKQNEEAEEEDEEIEDLSDEEISESEDKTGKFKISEELLTDDTNPQFVQASAEDELLTMDGVGTSEIDSEEIKSTKKNKIDIVDEDDEDEEDEDEVEIDEKALSDKKRKNVVYAIVVIALLYMVYDETTKETNSDNKDTIAVEKPIPKNKRINKKNKDDNLEITDKTKTKEIDPTKQVETNLVVEVLPQDALGKVEMKEELEEELKEELNVETNQVINNDLDKLATEDIVKSEPVIDEPNISPESDTQINEVPTLSIESNANEMEESDNPKDVAKKFDLDSQLNDIVKSVEAESKENQIKLEYIAPPNYENFGESLVYNCKGKHWACVDKKSHFECQGNYNWAKQNSKVPECSNYKVLASPSDCRKLQLYNINTVSEIPDCE